MQNRVEEIMRAVVSELSAMAKSDTIVGQPITMGENTVIPVVKISVGFGAGGGEGQKKEEMGGFGGGGGAGAIIEPAAFIVISGDKINLLPAKPKKFGEFVELIPAMIEKIKDWKAGSKKPRGESDSEKKEDNPGGEY